MNPLQPFALGLEAMRRALVGLLRVPYGRAWLLLTAVLGAVVVALAWAAHPALSWFLAPLLERSHLPGMLRYPEHFEALPVLTRRTIAIASVTVIPALSALTMIRARARWTNLPEPAVGHSLRRTPVYLLTPMPVLLVIGAMHAALPLLDGVRLSSITRAAIPFAVSFLSILLLASWAWMLPRVALANRSLLTVWREWPRHVARGFIPALIVIGSVFLGLHPFERALDGASHGAGTGNPEIVVAFALARVAAMSIAAVLVALAMALLHEAVPMEDEP